MDELSDELEDLTVVVVDLPERTVVVVERLKDVESLVVRVLLESDLDLEVELELEPELELELELVSVLRSLVELPPPPFEPRLSPFVTEATAMESPSFPVNISGSPKPTTPTMVVKKTVTTSALTDTLLTALPISKSCFDE